MYFVEKKGETIIKIFCVIFTSNKIFRKILPIINNKIKKRKNEKKKNSGKNKESDILRNLTLS